MSERAGLLRWIALLACLGPVPAEARQEGGAAARPDAAVEVPPPSENPSLALDQARDAQRAFERTRRRHHPRAAWGSDVCHEQIGRFCLNHDDDEGWTPPPEPPEVRSARARLIATLDSAARILPGDGWVIGQRLRYRVEAGRAEEALGIAAGCGGEPWWCRSLEGFVLHHLGRYGAAEVAFEGALASMSPARRCAWTDVGDWLEGGDASRYGRLPCDGPARASFERAFWHLSDPMWLVPGNELRAEHLARRVWIGLQEDAANGYGMPWGADLDELTARYGWPAGWDVVWRRNPGLSTDRSLRAHRPPESRRYAASELDRSAEDGGPAWRLEDDRPRTSWAPPYGPVHALDHQIAGFRRGEARLVVGAFAAPEELDGCPVRSGIFLANAFGEVARSEGSGTLPLRAAEPAPEGSATLAGLEIRCAEGSGAARARAVLAPTGKWLSDLLLLDPVRDLPGTLDAALFHARKRPTARAGESIVVFWEWYGPGEAAAPLSVTLSLAREEASFWRKALEWTGLADRDREEVGIRWSEPGDPDSPGRAVELRLPELEPGRYRLTLRVQSARVGTVSSLREVEIVP